MTTDKPDKWLVMIYMAGNNSLGGTRDRVALSRLWLAADGLRHDRRLVVSIVCRVGIPRFGRVRQLFW